MAKSLAKNGPVRALKFGLGIKNHGFNIYVSGYQGTGRKTAVKSFVDETAKTQPVPPDWCYVNNFGNPYEPKAVKMPSGKGKDFQTDMKNFIENIKTALPKAFESEDYVRRRETTLSGLENQRKAIIDNLNAKAQSEGFIIQTTPIGLLLIPVLDGRPLTDEEILALPQKTKEHLQEKHDKLEAELQTTMRQLVDMERQIRDAVKKLNREVALYATGSQITSLIEKYQQVPEVTGYLKEVQNDILGQPNPVCKAPRPAATVTVPATLGT